MITFDRKWCMPSSDTFSMKPLEDLAVKIIEIDSVVIDPFARNCKLGTIRNDINPDTEAEYHMDVIEFLVQTESDSADVILVDPPYSPRQVSECYQQIGRKVTMQDTQSGNLYKQIRQSINRIAKDSCKVIWCGWSTVGMTKGLGWELKHVLMMCHGGAHNDTIATVWGRSGSLWDSHEPQQPDHQLDAGHHHS